MALSQGEISERISKFSEGIVNRAVDLVILSIYFRLDLENLEDTGNEYERAAIASISGISKSTFTRALVHLRQLGLLARDKGAFGGHSLTDEGLARVNSLIPVYAQERIWDNSLYIISYELPVGRNVDRNALRDYLKSFGCGRLQNSSWLWHYNPKSRIDEYLVKHPEYRENVYLSVLRPEDLLGGRSMEEIVGKVYSLKKISDRYGWFVGEVKGGQLTRPRVVFKFLSILKDDPQVPYELVSENWMGYEAYELFKQNTD